MTFWTQAERFASRKVDETSSVFVTFPSELTMNRMESFPRSPGCALTTGAQQASNLSSFCRKIPRTSQVGGFSKSFPMETRPEAEGVVLAASAGGPGGGAALADGALDTGGGAAGGSAGAP